MTRILRSPALAGTLLPAVPLVALAAVASAIARPADQRVIVNFIIVIVLVLGIQTFSGTSGVISFGHVGFMGVGAYVAALLTIPPSLKQSQLPALPSFLADVSLGLLPTVVIASAFTALVAVVIGLPLTRMDSGALPLATIGVLVIFFVLFDNWEEVTRGSTGLGGIPQNTTVWWALGFAVVALFVARTFRESKTGLRLRASRTDPLAAQALGIDVVYLRLVAWTLSGAIMGAGGALWAEYNLAFGPRQFSFNLTFNLLAMLVIGGIAVVSGPVIGATVITALTETLRRLEGVVSVPGITEIAIGALILVVLYRRPSGLMGFTELDEVAHDLRSTLVGTTRRLTGRGSIAAAEEEFGADGPESDENTTSARPRGAPDRPRQGDIG